VRIKEHSLEKQISNSLRRLYYSVIWSNKGGTLCSDKVVSHRLKITIRKKNKCQLRGKYVYFISLLSVVLNYPHEFS
jgi:hypothetical protein